MDAAEQLADDLKSGRLKPGRLVDLKKEVRGPLTAPCNGFDNRSANMAGAK